MASNGMELGLCQSYPAKNIHSLYIAHCHLDVSNPWGYAPCIIHFYTEFSTLKPSQADPEITESSDTCHSSHPGESRMTQTKVGWPHQGDPISRKWPTQDSIADIVRSLYFIQKSHEISPVYLRSWAVYPDVLHVLVTNLRLDLLRKSHQPAPSQVVFSNPVPISPSSQPHLATSFGRRSTGATRARLGPRGGWWSVSGKPTGNTGGSPKYLGCS